MRKWLRDSTLPVETVSPRQQPDVLPFLSAPYLLTGGENGRERRCHPQQNSECKMVYIIAATCIAIVLLEALTVLGICALRYRNRGAGNESPETSPEKPGLPYQSMSKGSLRAIGHLLMSPVCVVSYNTTTGKQTVSSKHCPEKVYV